MTSTDSSASNNNNQSNTSDTLLETKVMNNENDTQVLLTQNEENRENTDTNNISSSEASSSPSAPSPSSSSPSTSSNNTSTDKAQNSDDKASKDSKSTKTHYSKKNSYNQNQNGKGSIDHSPIASGTTSNQQSQQFVNYYPAYMPRQGQAPQQYTQIDVNGQQQWPPAMAAAAAMAAMAANDPMAIAAYMNGPNAVQNGAPYPPGNPGEMSQQHYDQFSFGFTPAFGFGYAGNGSIDYAAVQAAQNGSNLNPQSNQWTPNNSTVPASSTSNNPTNPSLSPANTTASSNDTTPSVPSTTASETSAANQSKWVQVMQDPHAVHEFNTFQSQQLSPGDMYIPQHHHHNYRSHHHYQRHQHMQSNYHHYQYNNPYHMPHYQSQYNMQHPMQHHHYGPKNYNNYNKSNNHHNNTNSNDNSTGNYHDNNNNSNKSNNLNNADDKQEINDEINNISNNDANESKSESGSKSWASIVGVSSNKSSASNTPQASVDSPTTQNDVQLNFSAQNQMFHENSNYLKSKNNYYKNNYKQNNYESSNQQVFDLTNRSFPPIGDNTACTKAELNESIKKSSVKVNNKSENQGELSYQNYTMSQNSRKQQQYYNYQRQQQQQFNLPVTKFNGYHQNGQMNYYQPKNMYSGEPHQHRHEKSYNNEKPYKGEKDSYYKRHQPSAHTLSSFLNVLDKTKFDDSKSNKNNNSNINNQINGNQINGAVASNSIDELSQQTVNLNIDPNQLQVFTNPSAYNPTEFNTSPKAARFFVIKSYSEDDIHRSIKYNIWCSTEHGNRRLDSAYFKGDGQVPVYLFFSVNGSGHFCGMAEMQSRVDYNKKTGVWSQDKWRGCFQVKWIYVKDVPNSLLRNIKLENNDNKPVTNSRDTQEIPYDKGRQVLKVFHTYNHTSSILDDFEHYERKQEEDKTSAKIQHTFEKQQIIQKEPLPMQNVKPELVQNNITSSPSTSSSSSTYSIDESKKLKALEQTQSTQLIASSS